MLKKKSVFGGVLLLVLVALACIIVTVFLAFFLSSTEAELFDFSKLNFSNMIPVLIIGAIISSIIIGITALFVGRTVFLKIKDYLFENNDEK